MGETDTPLFTTFRDPAGHLELRPDAAYRTVRPPHDAEILEFLASPLAHRLVDSGQLIDSEVLALEPELQLRHPRVAFPSYPWEWSPGMWSAAARLTLELCASLLDDGWILKDATPLNVLFRGASPVFVDVLSVARADLRKPIWFAYGQFVRTFLLPLLAFTRLGWPLQAAMARRDGYEPEEIGRALPWFARWSQPARSTVTLPLLLSRMQRTPAKQAGASTPSDVEPDAATFILRRTLTRLGKLTEAAAPSPTVSAWSGYTGALTHYSEGDVQEKHGFIRRILGNVLPERVLDVGCNAGVYSVLAAEAGAQVVAIDTDLQTVDLFYRNLAGSPHADAILPLCIDLARPTPALGWENRETASFLDRAHQHFDLVLMLAVIHHLLLTSQIPMEQVAHLAARLTTRDLVIEWVPPSDEKFQEILRGRDEIYRHLTLPLFLESFEQHFAIVDQLTLTNGRTLFHMHRRM